MTYCAGSHFEVFIALAREMQTAARAKGADIGLDSLVRGAVPGDPILAAVRNCSHCDGLLAAEISKRD